jgi:zinc transport system substrate-binding protein
MIRQLGSVLMVIGFLVGSALSAVAGEAKVRVFVSVLPQKTFVERIGGERVDVGVLVSPGESPATYRPRPSLVAKLAAADLYFRVGVPFETHLMPKIQSMAGDLQVVDTRTGVSILAMGEEHHHGGAGHDDHGQEHGEVMGEHDIEGMDPHIWLDPRRVVIQAATMRDALTAVDPAGKEVYAAGYDALSKELMALHGHIAEALAPLKGETLYVFHPAFGYFADAYGLVQKAVEVEGKSPKGRALARFIQQAREEKVRVIFVQPQFDSAAAAKVAASVGGAVVPLDPLAPNYFDNLRQMADAVSAGLKE